MNKRNFYITFTLFFIVALFCGIFFLKELEQYSPLFFNNNSSYYFYSALFQANAAIISLFGVFFIFRIQSFQSSIDIIKNGLIADRGHKSWPREILEWDSYSLLEKQTLLSENKTHKNGNNNLYIREMFTLWTEKENKLLNIKKSIVIPTALISITMLIEIFCPFGANHIHMLGLNYEIIIMYINLILECSIIVIVFYHIIDIIKNNVV